MGKRGSGYGTTGGLAVKAVALVTESVIKSGLHQFLTDQCSERGIALTFYNVTESCARYSELFRSHRNVITWNCRMPHDWMAKHGNNVLYVENSLLWQRAGVFIDKGGFFSHSNLCRNRSWEQDHAVDLAAFTRQHFGWEPLAGGNPDGPILVCLQSTFDSNLKQEFPLGVSADDKVAATLAILFDHMPTDRQIIIRPNPRFIDHWHANHLTYKIRPEWQVSWEGQFHSILPTCSALVTVNSTCASEAATLGLLVATLGTGAFTGSGATLECATDPSRLGQLLQWQPDHTACRRYAEAILGRHFLSYSDPQPGNAELEAWLRAAF